MGHLSCLGTRHGEHRRGECLCQSGVLDRSPHRIVGHQIANCFGWGSSLYPHLRYQLRGIITVALCLCSGERSWSPSNRASISCGLLLVKPGCMALDEQVNKIDLEIRPEVGNCIAHLGPYSNTTLAGCSKEGAAPSSVRVYSSRGLVSRSSAKPSSTTLPAFMTARRSEI